MNSQKGSKTGRKSEITTTSFLMRILGALLLVFGLAVHSIAGLVLAAGGLTGLQFDSVHFSIEHQAVRVRSGIFKLPIWRFTFDDIVDIGVVTLSSFSAGGLGLRFGRKKSYLVVSTGPVVSITRKSNGRNYFVNCGPLGQSERAVSQIKAKLPRLALES